MYIVLTHEHAVDLEKEVKERLQDGWEPLGGVSVSIAYPPGSNLAHYVFVQAMVKAETRDGGIRVSEKEDSEVLRLRSSGKASIRPYW